MAYNPIRKSALFTDTSVFILISILLLIVLMVGSLVYFLIMIVMFHQKMKKELADSTRVCLLDNMENAENDQTIAIDFQSEVEEGGTDMSFSANQVSTSNIPSFLLQKNSDSTAVMPSFVRAKKDSTSSGSSTSFEDEVLEEISLDSPFPTNLVDENKRDTLSMLVEGYNSQHFSLAASVQSINQHSK